MSRFPLFQHAPISSYFFDALALVCIVRNLHAAKTENAPLLVDEQSESEEVR